MNVSRVLAGLDPHRANIINQADVMIGLVPVIHVVELPEILGLAGDGAAWRAGTSPAMTESGGYFRHEH
jgi:hypothetical protein